MDPVGQGEFVEHEVVALEATAIDKFSLVLRNVKAPHMDGGG